MFELTLHNGITIIVRARDVLKAQAALNVYEVKQAGKNKKPTWPIDTPTVRLRKAA